MNVWRCGALKAEARTGHGVVPANGEELPWQLPGIGRYGYRNWRQERPEFVFTFRGNRTRSILNSGGKRARIHHLIDYPRMRRLDGAERGSSAVGLKIRLTCVRLIAAYHI